MTSPQSSPVPAAPADPVAAAEVEALQAALLKGLGVPDLVLPQGLDAPMMENLGRILREMTEGTLEMLRLRSEAKSSLHADMTIIGPREVNPLKAAWDADVALRHLLSPQRADLMGPLQAFRDAFDDLRAHDRGLAAGIDGALAGLLERFRPEAIGARLEDMSALDRLFSGSRKARQWELLQGLYDDLAREGQRDFWSVFEREFRRAYAIGQPDDDRSAK
jgi:FHA domain-containing protein